MYRYCCGAALRQNYLQLKYNCKIDQKTQTIHFYEKNEPMPCHTETNRAKCFNQFLKFEFSTALFFCRNLFFKCENSLHFKYFHCTKTRCKKVCSFFEHAKWKCSVRKMEYNDCNVLFVIVFDLNSSVWSKMRITEIHENRMLFVKCYRWPKTETNKLWLNFVEFYADDLVE